MVKVITYGTYDLLHYGHIRLLERAKALGDYLVVGVTAEDFDKTRGKINVQQSLMERVEAVRATGIADEIIIEEYEGQKIDDIKRYDIDIFTVGSDWVGQFDYLNEYCKVVYLERTEGVSSTKLRAEKRKLKISVIGDTSVGTKFSKECTFVNGVEVSDKEPDAIYLTTLPKQHYIQIKSYLEKGLNVLCESPITTNIAECEELFFLAEKNKCVLMDGIKTAYSTAYSRLLLLVKSGKIGDVVSIDATCTSLKDSLDAGNIQRKWNSISAWGPTALLPVFQILGTNYKSRRIVSRYLDANTRFDGFTKIDFLYDNAVASIKVAKSAKSEGELIITGTKGYVYVPAPWWKTDYFEIRYENPADNRRYFYQLDGEGIRYQILAFKKSIEKRKNVGYIGKEISLAITRIMQDCQGEDVIQI